MYCRLSIIFGRHQKTYLEPNQRGHKIFIWWVVLVEIYCKVPPTLIDERVDDAKDEFQSPPGEVGVWFDSEVLYRVSQPAEGGIDIKIWQLDAGDRPKALR
jgi:hypothetical protein